MISLLGADDTGSYPSYSTYPRLGLSEDVGEAEYADGRHVQLG